MTTVQLEYETDFYQWIYQNILLLKERRFSEMDIDVLIDELDAMAKRDCRELTSRLMVLIANLLKWQFQSEKRSGSWRGSIREQRIKINQQLSESPSLKNQLMSGIAAAYPDAVKIAVEETGLDATGFPGKCPYSIAQLLDEHFYPNYPHN